MTRRSALWGAAAIALYVASAVLFQLPVAPRVLYDGLAPPTSYRYADPPPDLAGTNEEPATADKTVRLKKDGSVSTTVATGDGQAQLVMSKGAFEAKKGERAIEIVLEPKAPPPPLELEDGRQVTGNAYEVSAFYAESKDRAELAQPATLILRYPVFGNVVVQRRGSSWTALETNPSHGSLQLFAATDELGVFSTAGDPHTSRPMWIPYAIGAAGVVAGFIGYRRGRRTGKRRRRGKKRR